MSILIGSIFIYFMLLWVGYIFFFAGSIKLIINKFKEAKYNNIINFLDHIDSLPVTIIMPVYNYGPEIKYAIDSIFLSQYPNMRLIIVNDGSTDDTLDFLKKTYELYELPGPVHHDFTCATINAYYRSTIYPKMSVIDKQHYSAISSGADAINAGLKLCKTPLFMTIDADTSIDPESIQQMIFSYLSHPYCVAVGGNIYIRLVIGLGYKRHCAACAWVSFNDVDNLILHRKLYIQ
jgi:glycosyltransferase involved in cell wall biosynthesis